MSVTEPLAAGTVPAAGTVAALYDMKADPANRETLTYEEEGERHSIYFLRPRTREEALVRTGNPDSARDFSDVRDVVRAYVAAAGLDSGAYNVASGTAVSVRELIELVRAAARLLAEVRAHTPEVAPALRVRHHA